jgi:hypothetical protein
MLESEGCFPLESFAAIQTGRDGADRRMGRDLIFFVDLFVVLVFFFPQFLFPSVVCFVYFDSA